MDSKITAIRSLNQVFSQVVKSHHDARRSIKADDFGGNQLIQQMHCISAAFGGHLFDSIDRNGASYTMALSPNSMTFLVKLLRDFILVLDNAIKNQSFADHEANQAKMLANSIVNHDEDDEYPSPVEMVCMGNTDALRQMMIESILQMTPPEVDETIEQHVDSIISKLDPYNNMRSINLLRDVVLSTIEPHLAESRAKDEEELRAACEQKLAGYANRSGNSAPSIPEKKSAGTVVQFRRN